MFKLINLVYFILNLMPATSKIGTRQQKLGKIDECSKTMWSIQVNWNRCL